MNAPLDPDEVTQLVQQWRDRLARDLELDQELLSLDTANHWSTWAGSPAVVEPGLPEERAPVVVTLHMPPAAEERDLLGWGVVLFWFAIWVALLMLCLVLSGGW